MLPSSPILMFILFTFYHPYQGYLLDYPIKSPKGSLSIFSTLTDKSTQNAWTVKETLIVTPKVHGKIEITHGNDKIQVFYHENDDETRLVFYENQCYELKYTSNGWSSMMPTIDKPLLNMALLMGPSFYLRIVAKSNKFTVEDNVNLRGETMKNLVANIGKDLRVSFIFPVSLTPDIDTWQPKRLILTGWVPGSSNTHNPSETLFYDIYHEIKLPTTFDVSLATPTLGIGCPRYLESNQPFPVLAAKQYHVKVIETIKNSQSIDSISGEFSIDSRNRITRVKSVINQSGREKLEQSIIVYNLGIKYVLSTTMGTCYIEPMDADDDPSMDDNLIKMNPITLDIKDFKYVGQVSYEHRSGTVDVWESTEYNVTVGDTIYGKVVTTQFMAKQSKDKDNLGFDYLPVAAQRKFYNLNLDKFVLSESRERDIYDYDTFNYDDETDYRHSFQLTDCYDSPDDKMYLNLQISSSDFNSNQGVDSATENLYSLRETIKQIIVSNLNLSYLRITAIDIEFESIYIVARVEIIKEPDLLSSMDKREIKYDRQSFDDYFKVTIKDPVDCLKAQATTENIKYVISCMGLDNICVGVKTDQSMPRYNPTGSYCTVYTNRNDKLRKLAKEVTLEQLTKQFTRLIGIKFNLKCADCPVKWGFLITKVVQDSPPLDTKETRMLFIDVETGSKLNQVQSELVVGTKNFGDCYRACASPQGSTCETFSFCSSSIQDGSPECLISGDTYGSLIIGGTIINSSCSVYGKNNLLDYQKISSKRFTDIERSQPELSVRTADECARACVQAKEKCFSFQICDSRYCSFAGHYTASNSISDNFCDIYIPKMIENYFKNNHLMITPIIHSEVDLTLDQCASLCFSMRKLDDPNQKCKSFNYCPKGEAKSICQLSSVTISSSSSTTNPNLQISTSADCSNFEFIEKEVKQSNSLQEQQLVQQSNSAIGIIVFFVIIGLTMGLATPWTHNYLKKRFKRYKDEGVNTSTVQYGNMNDSTTTM